MSFFINFFKLLMVILLLLFTGTCENNNTEQTEQLVLPPGKLLWPHMKPDITQSRFDSIINNLCILNKFEQTEYGTRSGKSMYIFHDGFDIYIPNFTEIYAIEAGYVKWVNYNYGGGGIVIADTPGSAAGNGWSYGHLTDYRFKVGDYVKKGDLIGVIYDGRDGHIHLSRVSADDGKWDYWQTRGHHPDKYFVYKDTVPPVIETPFYFCKNNSDELFNPDNPTVVSGDVDIVVFMKDATDVICSNPLTEILGVTKIEYEITGSMIETVKKKSFDFTKIVYNVYSTKTKDLTDETVFTVFNLNTDFNHPLCHYRCFPYIITNTDGTGEFNGIDLASQNYAWNTAALDANGNPQFPNGIYTITVTAYDFMGNHSSVSNKVEVKN